MSNVVASRSESLRWFLREPSQQGAARLFCLPYSGSGASMYRNWPRFIGQVEVCPIQLPGRERRIREQIFATYEALADVLAEVLLPYLDRPFAFFGHCGSALPCYETAVRLWQHKAPLPVRLFISSQVAPHHGPYGRFLQMTDPELVEELKKLICELGGEPEDDLVAMCLGVLRADLEANKRYRPDSPVRLPCGITAIGWEDDGEVEPRLMAGWSDCGETTFRIFKGGHYRFLRAPEELLTAMAEDMQSPVSPA
jgi:surfactin synthase thioesterase subunit